MHLGLLEKHQYLVVLVISPLKIRGDRIGGTSVLNLLQEEKIFIVCFMLSTLLIDLIAGNSTLTQSGSAKIAHFVKPEKEIKDLPDTISRKKSSTCWPAFRTTFRKNAFPLAVARKKFCWDKCNISNFKSRSRVFKDEKVWRTKKNLWKWVSFFTGASWLLCTMMAPEEWKRSGGLRDAVQGSFSAGSDFLDRSSPGLLFPWRLICNNGFVFDHGSWSVDLFFHFYLLRFVGDLDLDRLVGLSSLIFATKISDLLRSET